MLKKILLASIKILTNSETCTKILIRSSLRLSFGRFSPVITSHWTKEKSAYKQTCHGRFTEQFPESQPGCGASITETRLLGGFLNAATSCLKRAPKRIFKINKHLQRSKKILYFLFLASKFKNHQRIHRKLWFNCIGPQKNIHLVAESLYLMNLKKN